MSLTLDAIKNNGLSPSLRRGAREGDVRDLCILTSYGGGRQPWKFCTRGAAHWMYTSPPSPLVGLLEQSRKPLQHIRRFGCTTRELRELVAWLHEFGVEHVAMESKGVYWKPGWNVLEGHFQIVLAKAQHIKAVPGRKTDTKDCQWIAELLKHGLLRSSFIPPVAIRDLRDLTRARTSLAQEHSRIASRIQKVLEDANIKLSRVASNTLGKSGRAILEAIMGNNTPI